MIISLFNYLALQCGKRKQNLTKVTTSLSLQTNTNITYIPTLTHSLTPNITKDSITETDMRPFK